MKGKAALIRDAILIGLVLLSVAFALAGYQKVEEQQRQLLDLKGEVQKLREALQPTPRPFLSRSDTTVNCSSPRHRFADEQTARAIAEVPMGQGFPYCCRLLIMSKPPAG
jgi:hypothetical protein